MTNPFDAIDARLSNIENLLLEIRHEPQTQAKSKPQEEILTVPEAASFLNLAIPTVYSLVSRGDLPVMKKNGRCYFSKAELMDYLKSGRKKTNTELQAEAEAYTRNKKGLK